MSQPQSEKCGVDCTKYKERSEQLWALTRAIHAATGRTCLCYYCTKDVTAVLGSGGAAKAARDSLEEALAGGPGATQGLGVMSSRCLAGWELERRRKHMASAEEPAEESAEESASASAAGGGAPACESCRQKAFAYQQARGEDVWTWRWRIQCYHERKRKTGLTCVCGGDRD